MSSWSPDNTALEQLVMILNGTLSPNRNIRVEATNALDKARSEQDFDNYLLHILVHGTSLEPQIRASAGLTMKNDLQKNIKTKPQALKDHLFIEIPKGLLDSQNLVRNITGNVITTLFGIVGVQDWPTLLPNLMELATGASGIEYAQEGAMSALSKICEDSSRLLDREYNGERPLNYIVPRLIELMGSPNGKVRSLSIACINQFLLIKTQSILVYLDEFMNRLFTLATDQDASVRTKVCTAFSSILEARPDKLLPHLDGVINYCVHSVKDSTEEVALEACEVLFGLSTSDIPPQYIKPKLNLMIPVLIQTMVYSEMDIYLMENTDSNDDENVEDKDDDIRPQMAKSKDAHKLNSKNANGQTKDDTRNGEDSDSEDEDDSDEDDDEHSFEWNLRKCSAATIDVLATNYPDEILEYSFPLIKERIVSPEWPVREASILALGAIAEGCYDQTTAQLPQLIPFLVERLKDSETRVRQITCWTLSRYSKWVAEEATTGGEYSNYFLPTFEAIMQCALDTKKVVQESGCSALSDFIDSSEPEIIIPLIEPLLQHFAISFSKYQRKNLIILYDTIQTFTDKIGDQLKLKSSYIETLLPPLLEKWQSLPDNDKDLWPLLECMSSVAAALGDAFAPYAVNIYQRAFNILARCVEQDRLAVDDPTIEPPEKDFIVTSIDLIDGLVQGLTSHSAELILHHDTNDLSLMKLLIQCFDDPTNDVRQSAYALLGDLSIYQLDALVMPHLHAVMVSIGNEISNRTFDSAASCNNAVWSLGEIVLRIPSNIFDPYLDNFMAVLLPLSETTDVEQTVLENASITIGRMGVNNPVKMGQYLSRVIITWCSYMKYLDENDEKETSFEGICNVIVANPTLLTDNDNDFSRFKHFIDCIANYESPSEKLANQFHLLLNLFKSGFGENWDIIIGSLDPFIGEILNMKYNV